MKMFLFLFVIQCSFCFAQVVTVQKKDKSKFTGTIISWNDSKISFDSADVKYNEVVAITFDEYRESDLVFYKKLKAYDVYLSFNNKTKDKKPKNERPRVEEIKEVENALTLIKLTNGTTIATKIRAASNSMVYTTNGNFSTAEIDSVIFASKKDYNIAELKNVKTNYGRLSTSVLNTIPDEVTLIKLRLNEYSKESAAGKSLMLAGLLFSVGSSVAINQINSDNLEAIIKNPNATVKKAPPGYLPWIGLGVTVIGISIDIGASMRLRSHK